MIKIIRTATVPLSLNIFCRGMMAELAREYDVLAVSSPGEMLCEIEKREGVRTVAVEISRGIDPLKDIVSLYKLVRLFRREKPQMVHSMTPKAGLLSMMAARIAGVKVRVHTFTGLLFPTAKGLRRRLFWLTDIMTCACATQIIPEGEGVMNDLYRYHVTAKPMKVLGHGNVRGIDLNHYDRTPELMRQAATLRRSLNISDTAFVFVFVGRLVADKGICELLDAFRRLRTTYHDVYLLLVGSVEAGEDKLERMIDARDEHVVMPGWQEDVRPWYAMADVLAFPSYREGFPNVVIEAGAMQLPCIVTDINGSREIIEDGKNGVIIPSQDTDALYDAMRMMLSDSDKRKRMADAARPMVASRYEQGYVRQCLKNYYHEILL